MADRHEEIVLGSGPGGYVAAIGAGEARPEVVDGADGAQLMQALKASVEAPLRRVS